MNRSLVLVCTTSAVMLAAGRAAYAGPIDPPAGPVSSSMKPLDQVEPRIAISTANTPGDSDSLFRITQPGSYYLTGNVTGVAGKSGIEIAAGGVTVDLNGFHMEGVAGSLDGVTTPSGVVGVTVRDGVIQSWGGSGVNLKQSHSCRVSGVTASYNGGAGIQPGQRSLVEGCVAHQNSGLGISTGTQCVVRGCAATQNSLSGIFAYAGSTVEASTAQANGGAGIEVGNGSAARGCTASGNEASGIQASDSSQVLDCIATSNGLHGIDAGWGVQISRCSANTNQGHGIECGAYGVVTDSNCRQNGQGASGGAGLYVGAAGTRARLEGNNCVQNDWGIRIDGTTNLAFGNTCTSNGSNFEIVANNRVGAVVVLPMSGAVSGNSGGSSVGADPVCNFAF
ncbi:MAG TPA: right-handed parallel beta-helix repeat-containing protein [Phycisphaerales bacterium]|nr:right-handed parallel beta-helix repeat-containing protein [Phycisphaerales bacterium]